MSQAEITNLIHDRHARGHTKLGWLDSYHTFSFGGFRDPSRMGFRALRVINDDRVVPGAGFGTHSHRDMEIVTYVLDGALEHKDSLGNGAVIRPGEIQKMSAGTGITHSEFNYSKEDPVHFYQIWIMPDTKSIKPGYEQILLDPANFKNGFQIVGDRQGSNQTISICQDAKMLMAMPDDGAEISYSFTDGRYGFLQVARGQITLNSEVLKEGDGVEIANLSTITVFAQADSELILFDLG
ncbi:MAG: pirin family protein [Cyanobacteria bacterium P01_F01_bin.86]